MLRDALQLAQAGKLNAAEQRLLAVLDAMPRQPDALQLLGMVARQRGDHYRAVDLFRKSLAAHPRQPHVLNNLGNSLLDRGEISEAAEVYREALQLLPAYSDARINLALSLTRLKEFGEVEACLAPLLDRASSNGRAWAVLAEMRGAIGDHPGAVEAYRLALQAAPDHLPWRHNLAVALRQTGRAHEALPILLECAASSPERAEIPYNLGHCLQDLGHFEDAAQAYRHAIKLAPTDAAIHESLSRMLWHQGRVAEHVVSYRKALEAHPDHPDLLEGLARRLTLAKEPEQAVELLETAVSRGVSGAGHLCLLGQALWSSRRAADAARAFDAALKAEPEHAPTLREYARILLILERYDDALSLIRRRLASDPNDQQMLALQAIVWRLKGDPKYEWLENPDFIRTCRLGPRNGNAEGFNSRLNRTLRALHSGQQAPLEQTLRGGTQTADDLFNSDNPEIAAVRAMIEEAVARYIAALPNDADHPFLCRKAAGFSFSGSWSAQLGTGGHHTNHIHPAGWISAVYYVALPASLEGDEGCLKFGETGLHLERHERILRTIRPEPGLLVLFPSYFYHGTVPFSAEAHRMTIAFDVVPTARLQY